MRKNMPYYYSAELPDGRTCAAYIAKRAGYWDDTYTVIAGGACVVPTAWVMKRGLSDLNRRPDPDTLKRLIEPIKDKIADPLQPEKVIVGADTPGGRPNVVVKVGTRVELFDARLFAFITRKNATCTFVTYPNSKNKSIRMLIAYEGGRLQAILMPQAGEPTEEICTRYLKAAYGD